MTGVIIELKLLKERHGRKRREPGDARLPDLFNERVEAPPGFEPGVEVLQSGLAITKLLSRLAFWSALILVLPRFRRVLFPSCSQVHFPRKLLIFDLRFAL